MSLPVKPAAITAGALTILPTRRLVMHAGQPLRLSSQEYDALEALALAGGRPVVPADLVVLVLGRAFRGRGDKGASSLIFRLRQRLPLLPDGGSPIVTVSGAGFALLMPKEAAP